jgi:hypothetical protein
MTNVAASSERLAAVAGRLIDYMRRFTLDQPVGLESPRTVVQGIGP